MNETSDSPKRCQRCGSETADATQNLCPRCLMAQAMQPTQPDDEAVALPPLTPEELAPHFPQLEILECLGRGGMGVVYKARQKSLNRLVALKLLAPERADDPQFAARFEKEAHALAALNHPHIVAVYDFGQTEGFYYLLMEYVDGVNLRQLLRSRRLTPKEALSIVPPVCEALQCAHDRGIVHRDIKPENLLIDKAGTVKIADFGIAKIVASDVARQPSGARQTAEGCPKGEPGGANHSDVGTQRPVDVPTSECRATLNAGTPDYAAPEQHESGAMLDHRADIYSLGVVLYEMLTGERPKGKIEPPSKRVQVDIRIDDIVLRALEKAPELRYATAAEFRTRVEAVVTEKMPPLPTAAEKRGRYWRMAVCVLLAAVALWSWAAALSWSTRMPMSVETPIAIGIFAAICCLSLVGLVMMKPLRLFMGGSSPGVSSANPPVFSALFVLLMLVTLAACVFGLLLQEGWRGEGAVLLLVTLAAAVPLVIARAKFSGAGTAFPLGHWLRALGTTAFILAAPCIFLGGMFVVAIIEGEHRSLNPSEAFTGALLCVVAVLLPIAGVRLRSVAPSVEHKRPEGRASTAVTVGAVALVLFLLPFLLYVLKQQAASREARNRQMQAIMAAEMAETSAAMSGGSFPAPPGQEVPGAVPGLMPHGSLPPHIMKVAPATTGGMIAGTLQFRWILDKPSRDSQELTLEGGDPNAAPIKLLVDRNVKIDQRDVELVGASATETGEGKISILLNNSGQMKFATLTREGIGKRLGIVVEGRLLAAPVIQSEITQGKLDIAGSFTPADAKRMADAIRASLPNR